MKVNMEFDLKDDEDRKMYNACIKMKEITLNLEKFKDELNWANCAANLEDNFFKRIKKVNDYFEEMIWRKLG